MKTITVTSNGQLMAAINELEASGGGRIELENTGQSYNLTGHNLGTSDGVITITSADINDQAVVDGVRLNNAENLSFESLDFNSSGVSRASWIKDFMVDGGKNISITDSTFTSRADGTFMESGAGVSRGEDMGIIRDTDGFTFENNLVTNYFNGIALIESNDLNVTGNEFAFIQGDGIRGGGMQDAVFKDNWFHDWYGSAKSVNHDDMFQIWGTNMDQLSKNILIDSNFFDSGGGTATQTILIQNEHWRGEDDYYTNIVISNNVIYNGHTHGISVNDATGVQVLDNTVLYDSQAATPTGNVTNPPSIRVHNPEGAVVTGNIANKIYVDGKEVTEDNIWIDYKSPSDPNYFDKHIVNIESGGHVDLRDLELRPDSPWAGEYGADASQNTLPQTGVTAVMTHTEIPGEYGTYILDATLSQGTSGYLSQDDTTFEWHFADGTVIESPAVEVEFDNIGLNEVKLVVKTADGQQDTITRDINVENSTIREIDFNAGSDTSGLSFEDYSEGNFVDGLNGGGFQLDGDSEAVLNKKISDLYELDQFTIEIAFQKTDPDSFGALLDFHRSMTMSLRDDGSVRFGMNTKDGSFSVETSGAEVSDTDWHKVSIVYNSYNEELSLWLDGNKLDQTHATGETIPFQSWGPQLGTLDFKAASVQAVVDDFAFRKEALDDVEVQQDHVQALSLDAGDLDTVYQPAEGQNVGGNSYQSVEGADEIVIVTQPSDPEPDEPVVEPDEPVVEPDEPVVEPDEPVVEPDEPVVEPDEPVVEPDEPVVEPDEPVVEPDEPVVEPDEPVVEPDEPVVEPDEPVVEPDEPVVEPDEPVVEPDEPVVDSGSRDAVISHVDFNAGFDTKGIAFEDASEANFVAGLNGAGFLLDGDSEAALSKKIHDLHEMDQFTIEVAIQKVDADSTGKLLDFHRTMFLTVLDDSSVRFSMETKDGNFSVATGDVQMSDTDWHKLSVVYNSHIEELSIWLDGNKLGESHATGETIPYAHWGPQLGNPDFKADSVQAVVDDFAFYREALDDAEIQQGHVQALSLEMVDLDEVYLPDVAQNAASAVAQTSEEPVVIEDVTPPAEPEETVPPEPEDTVPPVDDEEAPQPDATQEGIFQDNTDDLPETEEASEPESPAEPVEQDLELLSDDDEENSRESVNGTDPENLPDVESEIEPDTASQILDDIMSEYQSETDLMLIQNPHMTIELEDIPLIFSIQQLQAPMDTDDEAHNAYDADYYVI